MIQWKDLSTIQQLDDIAQDSQIHVIFKHSTRCSVSSMAKRSLEYSAVLLPPDYSLYYLDLIRYREISNMISEKWQVHHESPQILVIKGNECLFYASHGDIEMADIIKFIS